MMTDRDPLQSFPRERLMKGPTPIQRLARLEEVLGERSRGVSIWAKRDDLMELGGGGNKLRKLEFLLGQAKAEGCDTLVVTGGVQSNFARLAAAACARSGLACELVLAQMVPRTTEIYQDNGNVLLDRLFGASVHILDPDEDAGAYARRRVDEIAETRRRALLAPLGGSTTIGCLGYVDCAFELARQSAETGVAFEQIIIPNGSGGMHAGLAAGVVVAGSHPSRIAAYTVLSPADKCLLATADKVNAVLERLASDARVTADDLRISSAQLGEGYGMPTSGMIDAVELLARSEGLLVDPVYGGKALAGLLSDVESGAIAPQSNVLFIMTGGSPGLYAYADVLTSK
ncbi:pyridoxal-phosphate dependent enzyme [Sinorhizobium medicae]|uniref:1-aminocyclopropane-1-carboxylate deaminase n=2 Tax=Sinorhizobium medicae TaxID=110321 RepID=A6UKV2_SINMW|nr:1-aminocyclopropane-1-carboxylate deaminase [Sinorhizobium medicae WSM419]MDX0480929.1 pyridoxal-phosphate dependent enzyme [Sinorhizobium medicae]MDX0548386.1 pyridoxal-phosphate dependent enzyme [Sinorhizobium medicae]MDX0570875.1 pyridoxal-phosphate dependent enzyme [Sinorhizobium medicae]MDX0598694.1 pyridoxal-phosphate dependent enzyme [Sinorhizobium medicae]